MFKVRIIFIVFFGLIYTQGFAAAPAAGGAGQTAQTKRSHEQLLASSIRWANIGAIQILLMDPATSICNERANSENLITATTGGAEQTDPSKDKKIIKMLLFFGFNPTYKELRGISAQEAAHELDFHDKDYSTWMDDYKNIEKYCSEKELAEFRAIKTERMHSIRELEQQKKYKKLANLASREIGNKKARPIIAKKLDATPAATFAWPSKDCKKDKD